MKIHVDSKRLFRLGILLFLYVCLLLMLLMLVFDDGISRYLGDWTRIGLFILGLITSFLAIAFARGSIRFSSGTAKTD
jgi:hypothetical protein